MFTGNICLLDLQLTWCYALSVSVYFLYLQSASLGYHELPTKFEKNYYVILGIISQIFLKIKFTACFNFVKERLRWVIIFLRENVTIWAYITMLGVCWIMHHTRLHPLCTLKAFATLAPWILHALLTHLVRVIYATYLLVFKCHRISYLKQF